MNFSEIKEKTKDLFSRVGRKTVIVVCAVLLIGTAVLLNFILRDGEAEPTDAVKQKTDLSDLSSTVKESDTVAEYFATMVLNRKNARGEAVDVLKKVVESDTAVDEMKNQAAEDLKQIAKDIESEANIETLILAKGFEKCIAVISGETASVIVQSDGLLPSELSQIKEIVWEQASILPENLKIVAR